MYIYLLLINLIGILYILINIVPKNKQRLISSLILGALFFLVMGLRDSSVGSDTNTYLDLYNAQDFLNQDFFFRQEYGFQLYMRLFTILGFSDRFFILINSLIITFSFAYFFYTYSKNICFSFFLHLTIGLFAMTMSGLRQSLAICIILFSIDLFFKKKKFFSIISIYVASTFHISALFFIISYFSFVIKITSYRKILYILMLISPLIIFRKTLIDFIGNITYRRYLELYGGIYSIKMNILLLFIAILIPVFIVILWKISNKNLKLITLQESTFFKLTCLNTIITFFAIDSIMLLRFSYYFIPAYIVLIPNAIMDLKSITNKYLISVVIIVVCIVYFVLGTVGGILKIDNYLFFF